MEQDLKFTSHQGSGVSRETEETVEGVWNSILIKTQPLNYKMLQYGHL